MPNQDRHAERSPRARHACRGATVVPLVLTDHHRARRGLSCAGAEPCRLTVTKPGRELGFAAGDEARRPIGITAP